MAVNHQPLAFHCITEDLMKNDPKLEEIHVHSLVTVLLNAAITS